MASPESIDQLTARNIQTIAHIEQMLGAKQSRAERMADLIAFRLGSWPFIIIQAIFLICWMLLNVKGWIEHWDPFPFILLNLALSFQSAFAGPIIMMSQNRQSRFIQRRNELDLQINLLAEQETTEMLRLLRLLCEKSGIPKEQLGRTDILAQETQPEKVFRQIAEKEVGPKPSAENQ